jgi:hypothetical protein
MTPESQRIAIAEVCGWEFAPGYPQQLAQNKTAGVPWQYINGQHCADGTTLRGVPNYLTDLNAMHEAEKVLTEEQLEEFTMHLDACLWSGYPASRKTWHATAAQRAEAFLRTLNLWKDDE